MSNCPMCGYNPEPVSWGGWTFADGRLQEYPKQKFTAQEAKLICFLLRAHGRFCAVQDIMLEISRSKVDLNIVNVVVCRVREKAPKLIGSARHQGFCILEKTP